MTDTAIVTAPVQVHVEPRRAIPTMPEILAQLGQLRPMYKIPSLIGVCKDGLPIILDLGKPQSLIIDLNEQDAARLLWVMFQSAKHWVGEVEFQLIHKEIDLPEQPSNIILIPDRLGFLDDSRRLLQLLQDRTAFLIVVGCELGLPRFDMSIGIDAWGRWYTHDYRIPWGWFFDLPESE